MAIRIGTTLKFPAQVEGTDGVVVTRENGVFTFSLDPDLADLFGFARLEGGNAFSGVQTITTGSGAAGLNVLSGSTSLVSNIHVGRAIGEVQLGVAASADQFFTGTVAADVALRAVTGNLFIGSGSSIAVKVSMAGALRFPQHVSGALLTDASGNVTATTNTGSGNNVLATSPTLTTPVLGVATATSINKVALTAPTTSATLTIADGKTLTASATLTLAGTDGSTLNIGTGGTLGTAAFQNTGTSGANVPLLNGANTWSGIQSITVNGAGAQLIILSGSASGFANINIGRTGSEYQQGVAGATNDFFTGTAAGDGIVKGTSGKALWFGTAVATPVVKLGDTSITFPQHVSGALSVNGAGVLAAGTLAVGNGGTGVTSLTPAAYTCNVSSGSGSITTLGTVIARFLQIGKLVWVRISITITTNGTAAGAIIADLPTAAHASGQQCINGVETATLGIALRGFVSAGATTLQIARYDNSYPGGDGRTIVMTGVYEAA